MSPTSLPRLPRSAVGCWRAAALVTIALPTLTACTDRLNTLGWTGSSSMRVEVEVYKGPLSKEKSIQVEELVGMIKDSTNAIQILQTNVEVSMCRIGCFDRSPNAPWSYEIGYANQSAFEERDMAAEPTIEYDFVWAGTPIRYYNRKSSLGIDLPDIYRSGSAESICGDTPYDIRVDRHPDDSEWKSCHILLGIHKDLDTLEELSCDFAPYFAEHQFCDKVTNAVAAQAQRFADLLRAARGLNQEVNNVRSETEAFLASLREPNRCEGILAKLLGSLRTEESVTTEQARAAARLVQRVNAFVTGLEEAQEDWSNTIAKLKTATERSEEVEQTAPGEGADVLVIPDVSEELSRLDAAQTALNESVDDLRLALDSLHSASLRRFDESGRNANAIIVVHGICETCATAQLDQLNGLDGRLSETEGRLARVSAGFEILTAALAERRPRYRAAAATRDANGNVVHEAKGLYRRAAQYGARMRNRAAFWAAEHTGIDPKSRRVRIEMAGFSQFAAEYGNQITSRADALMKQEDGADGPGLLREQLASSVYLRDSAPTGYLDLYEFNAAAVERPGETAQDRIRLVEHLVRDTYWSNVNTVFAAGQGEASMAFVKDDIGNWNLKNYENKPGELLDAYKQVGLTAVEGVAQIAGTASGAGLPGVANALQCANQIALGSTSGGRATDTEKTIVGMNVQTAKRIQTIGAAQQGRIAPLTAQVETQTGVVTTATATRDQAQTAVNITQAMINGLDTQIAGFDGQLNELTPQVDEARRRHQEALAAYGMTLNTITRLQSELADAQDPTEQARLWEELAAATAEGTRLERVVQTEEMTFNTLQAQQAGVQEQKTALAAQRATQSAILVREQAALTAAQGARDAEQAALADLQAQLADINAETGERIRELLRLQAALIDQLQTAAVADDPATSTTTRRER